MTSPWTTASCLHLDQHLTSSPRRAHIRFFGHQDLHILRIRKESAGTTFISGLKTFPYVRRASQSTRENKVRLDQIRQYHTSLPISFTYDGFSSMAHLQSFQLFVN